MASISPGTQPAGAWSPQTQAERAQVLRHLDRILESPLFRSSKRNPALLKYIVEQTLEGHSDALKERLLGIEVFGRAPDYDTNSDHVVRTAAGEIRKRLAQYYLHAGAHDEIRIDVPAGSYVAQFSLSPAAEPASPAEGRPKWSGSRAIRLFLAGSLVANAILATVLILGSRPWFGGAAMLRKFWDPVFTGSRPVLICVGLQTDIPAPPDAAAPNRPAAGDLVTLLQDPLMRRVNMADLLALARVAGYAGQRHARYRVEDPASTSFSDLQSSPTVLIGVNNNKWTRSMADGLRFAFERNSANRTVRIVDKRNPEGAKWVWSMDPAVETTRDYALVSRLLDRRVEQIVVIVGGLGPHGTEVAGHFITDPDQIQKLSPYTPAGWAKKNLQVVLSAEVVKGSSGPPKVEAAYFW
jgi:hypothetical protein